MNLRAGLEEYILETNNKIIFWRFHWGLNLLHPLWVRQWAHRSYNMSLYVVPAKEVPFGR